MNAFKVTMLASGSKGNSALISTSKQNFLVDMGISCRMLTSRFKEIGFNAEDLDGVLITHEHTDHINGLTTFTKKYSVPIYSSELTWRAILSKQPNILRHNCRMKSNIFSFHLILAYPRNTLVYRTDIPKF